MTPEESERTYSGTIVAAVIFGMMIAGLVYRYWPSDERDILRHISNLGEALSLPGAESEPLSATRFAALREYFAPDVRFRWDDQEIVTREVLLARLRSWTPPPLGVRVEFVDVRVTLAENRATATVQLTAHLSTRRTGQDDGSLTTRAIVASMTHASGDWVIATADASAPD